MSQKYVDPVNFDYSRSNTLQQVRSVSLSQWIFICLSLGILGLSILELAGDYGLYMSNADKLIRREAEAKRISVNIQSRQPVALSAEEIALQNDIIKDLNTPWSALFETLDTETKDITLLALEPNIQKRTMKIQAEARTRQEMNTFLKNLERRSQLKNIILHQFDINQTDPVKPVRFSFDVTWSELK